MNCRLKNIITAGGIIAALVLTSCGYTSTSAGVGVDYGVGYGVDYGVGYGSPWYGYRYYRTPLYVGPPPSYSEYESPRLPPPLPATRR